MKWIVDKHAKTESNVSVLFDCRCIVRALNVLESTKRIAKERRRYVLTLPAEAVTCRANIYKKCTAAM